MIAVMLCIGSTPQWDQRRVATMTGFFSAYSMDTHTLLELTTLDHPMRKQSSARPAEAIAGREQILSEDDTFRALSAMRCWLSSGGRAPT